jgi:hypothetical protein
VRNRHHADCRVAVERAADRYTLICDGPYMFAGPPFGEEADDVDAIAAGDGKDAIEAKNVPAAKDVVDCGAGFDRVLVDGKDLTSECERKFTSPREFFRSIRGEGYFAPLRSL